MSNSPQNSSNKPNSGTQNLFNYILNQFKRLGTYPKWLLISLLSIAILIGSWFAYKSFFRQIDTLTEQVLAPVQKAYELNLEMLNKTKSDSLSEKQIEILNFKIQILEERKKHHIKYASNVFKNQYVFYSLLPFFSAITAILIFFIMRKGWEGSSSFLKAAFLLFAGISAIIGLLPDIYQQEASIKKNLTTYLNYTKLQKGLLDYAITSPVLYGDTIEFYPLIDSFNLEEKNLIDLFIDIQEGSVNEGLIDDIISRNKPEA